MKAHHRKLTSPALVISRHVRTRCKQRGIPFTEVIDAVNGPAFTKPSSSRPDRRKLFRNTVLGDRWRWLVVVVEERIRTAVVVTAYCLEKIVDTANQTTPACQGERN